VRVLAWRVPPFDNGTYLVYDERKDAILIDPARGERHVLHAVREQGLRLLEILNTHGHPDHIHDNAAVKEATRARLAIHRLDAYRLDPARRPASALDVPVPECAADDLIEEGPLPYLQDTELVALHTPGHTEGSTCFHVPAAGVLFSGDLLFAGTCGRWDLPGGDGTQMEESLRRIAALPPATRVYPGHGPLTTIGDEIDWLRTFRVRAEFVDRA
jgi:hydroxyacylglutathione hydrolase